LSWWQQWLHLEQEVKTDQTFLEYYQTAVNEAVEQQQGVL